MQYISCFVLTQSQNHPAPGPELSWPTMMLFKVPTFIAFNWKTQNQVSVIIFQSAQNVAILLYFIVKMKTKSTLQTQTSDIMTYPWEECHVLVGNRPQRWPVTKKNTAFFPQIYKSPCPTWSLDHLNKVYCLIGRVPVRGSRCITKLQSGYKLRCC